MKLSLDELLKQADEYDNPNEWQAQFKLNYLGKWVVFDDGVYLDPRGQPSLQHHGEVTWKKAGGRVDRHGRVVVDDLKLLRDLPLTHGKASAQRWIFGARLVSITQEGEEWLIRFEPNSGILLTDLEAVKAWKPGLRDDPELSAVLQRQEERLQQLRVPEPEVR